MEMRGSCDDSVNSVCSLGYQRKGISAHSGTGHQTDGDATQRRGIVEPHHRLERPAQRVHISLLAGLLACTGEKHTELW